MGIDSQQSSAPASAGGFHGVCVPTWPKAERSIVATNKKGIEMPLDKDLDLADLPNWGQDIKRDAVYA